MYKGVSKSISKLFKKIIFVHMIERKTKSKMIKYISIDNTINFI